MCGCQLKATQQYADEGAEGIKLYSISAEQATDIVEQSRNALRDALSAASAPGGQAVEFSDEQAVNQLHITPDGDVLASSGFARDTAGQVVLRGVIAGIPYELHVSVELTDATVTLTLELTKPIHIGPYTWKFKLGGIIRDGQNKIVGAASIAPVADLEAFNLAGENVALFGLSWWCVLKCGGITFLPILALCLPALLSGGPPAFIACVVAKLGEGAAGVAACVAKKCVK